MVFGSFENREHCVEAEELWSAVFVLQKRTELIDYNTASDSDVNQYTSDNYTDNMAKQHAVNETKHSRPFTRWLTSFMKTALYMLTVIDTSMLPSRI